MALNKDLEKLKFDKRMIEWNFNQKQITPSDVQKYLKSLEDISQWGQPMFQEKEKKDDSSSVE